MSEVLKLEFHYNASSESGSLLVTLDAVGEYVDDKGVVRTRTVIGPTLPSREFSLAKLAKTEEGARQVANYRAFLVWLERTARAATNADVADPDAIREEANRVARERKALAEDEARHRAAVEAKQAELAALDAEIAKRAEAPE